MAILTILCILAWATSIFLKGQPSDIASLVAIALGSVQAFKTAIESIRARQLDINVLMILAGAGAVSIGRYFDAATLLMLFSLSGTLEAFALGRTEKGMEALMKLRPKTAVRVRNNSTETVPVEQLEIGDQIRIDGYSAIPADSTLLEGSTSVDESAMTGESVPVSKVQGDTLMAGTQNLEGSVVAQVTVRSTESSIDRVIAMVKEARENKAETERFSLWFGQTYTIAVISASLLSLLVRYLLSPTDPGAAFYQSLVLLVAMSPCALVISTPAAVLSALAFSARMGILVRGGAALETAGKIKTVVLDKTGTLTMGRFKLRQIILEPGWATLYGSPIEDIAFEKSQCAVATRAEVWKDSDPIWPEIAEVIRIAAAVEERSSHPLAQAIVQAAKERNLPIPSVRGVTVVGGMGLIGSVEGSAVRIGRSSFFPIEECEVPAALEQLADEMRENGLTVVLMGHKGKMCAFGLEDEPRAAAISLIAQLHEQGIKRVVLATGDSKPAANAVAQVTGIDEVHAAMLPGGKQKLIESLQKETGAVLMLGDGVNDAPALTQADIGVAMGGLGSDVAIKSSDAVLVQDRLDRIPLLLKLGKSVNRIIRQNLTIAAGSIAALTLWSFFGNLPLGLAVLGHEGTTVLVILNGLRLLRGA